MRTDWLSRLTDLQVNWLAGLLEGEGSFMSAMPSDPGRPIVAVSMTDEDIVARIATMWQVAYRPVNSKKAAENGWRIAYTTRLSGRKAVELMNVLRPLMGARRQSQIDKALASWAPTPKKVSRAQAAQVQEAVKAGRPVREVAAQYGISRWTVYAIARGAYFDRPDRPGSQRSAPYPWPALDRACIPPSGSSMDRAIGF